MKKSKQISIGLIIFAFTLMFAAIMQFNKTKYFIDNGNKTTATVIELLQEYDEGSTLYTPVFRYINEMGDTVTFESSVSSDPPEYRVGDIENIIYMPNTDDAKVDSLWGLYTFVIVLSIISAISGILGILFFISPEKVSYLK